LQRWFTLTRHREAANPYFLYAASNLGSILALLAYPLALEPVLRLQEQSRLWAGIYMLLLGMVLGCALLIRRDFALGAVVRYPESGSRRAGGRGGPGAQAAHGQRLRWVPFPSCLPASSWG
jgi:hypothetical protein